MRIQSAKINNFRLLSDVELCLEERTTVIVGRNNSGKTSLSEIIRRFLSEGKPNFNLEDFSTSCYDNFCKALHAVIENKGEDVVRGLLPAIEMRLVFNYDLTNPDFGPLGAFIIDLDPKCSEAVVVVRYELQDGEIKNFFEGHSISPLTETTRPLFLKALKERIPKMFGVKIWAEDPNDATNRKPIQSSALRNLLKTGFINAQRGLDDITSKETDVLAKVLESLFVTASTSTADASDQKIAESLKIAVEDIQTKIDTDFANQLKSLIPTLKTFGYPGLKGPDLQTETTLDVKKLLSNFTKVRYSGHDGITLPESYNGLGSRNLIFILLQLVGFYKEFRADNPTPGIHLIFIEEPEAHLHPQMQEVFIRQLSKIVDQLTKEQGGIPWPVQFIVSTHSSHIANEAGFESIRYFLASSDDDSNVRQTKIKDLREGLKATPADDIKFLHQYMTLTRCDLFFADKAILVEGLSERLLLPSIIEKLEDSDSSLPKLSTQYMTVIEVGGAYAHLFFELLGFLELPFLVITDLDSVEKAGGSACPVHKGKATSNECIKKWFNGETLTLDILLAKKEQDMIKGKSRIAYQHSDHTNGACGRTFEDAFILKNTGLFNLVGSTRDDQELRARDLAAGYKKSDFALKYAIEETTWETPGYIVDGVQWLAKIDTHIQQKAPVKKKAPSVK